MIVRELTTVEHFDLENIQKKKAVDTAPYTRQEIERISRKAFEIAKVRGKKLTSVDKHNVLDTSKLWKKNSKWNSTWLPEVEVSHMYVTLQCNW